MNTEDLLDDINDKHVVIYDDPEETNLASYAEFTKETDDNTVLKYLSSHSGTCLYHTEPLL